MGYLLVGVCWCWWLEYYTTDRILLRPWIWRERFFHTLLWPLSLSIFVYNLFNN
jgi:hypothetical protein